MQSEYGTPPTTFVAIILAFWSTFHLIHSFILNNDYVGHKVASFLAENNISVTFFHVRWFTSRWNRMFIWIGRMWNSQLKVWFDAGVLCGLITMIVGTMVLVHTLYSTVKQTLFRPPTHTPEQQVLSVVIPGVTLPIQDIWYLMFAILLSGILHEFGHAIAAARESVQINGFGMFAFLIYPGAFVDLNSEDMNRKDPIFILYKGVWHNFIICVVACALILAMPWLLLPFYTTHGTGVLVIHQTPNSPLLGDMGLYTGDHITEVDACTVSNTSNWYYCINKTKKSPQWGSCVAVSKIKELESHTAYRTESQAAQEAPSHQHIWMDCCDAHAPATHLCYEYTESLKHEKIFNCLPGRVIMTSPYDCLENEDCNRSGSGSQVVCTRAHTEPGTKFIRLVATRGSEKHNVLFVGDPMDIIRSVSISTMFPRYSWLPLRLPSILLRFLQYTFSMSGALALLNIVPCYALDGQWALKAMLDYGGEAGYVSTQAKSTICRVALFCGTLLLAANIFFGFVHIFTR